VTYFPKLYEGKLHELVIGLIGALVLCNFIRPLILGGVRFQFLSFQFTFCCTMLLLCISCFTSFDIKL
jgi:uncharacterized membrane protein YeaQ/YmgE (transglycosylase-associated protein family)